ncbi:MAG: hypothetical protein HDS74_07025 [Bacteroidales bacterium]|nr:hypothetical protein [Bacteroidales bacterium]MBD5212825.1 hypothetical protein [Bacteroidales bacterium]MBD5216897.1 hypothetical protein [Bacteroidales bacterium]
MSTKKETVERLSPLYLRGKSQEMIDRFRAKSLEHQYISLKNWESRMRKKNVKENSMEAISLSIENLRKAFKAASNLSSEDISELHASIDSLHSDLNDAQEKIRIAMITDLERQQEEIRKKLEELQK